MLAYLDGMQQQTQQNSTGTDPTNISSTSANESTTSYASATSLNQMLG